MPPLPIALVLTLLLCAASAWPDVAHACKCALQSTAEAKSAASAIFEGRVEAIEPTAAGDSTAPAPLRVKLAVVRSFKGADAEQLEVVTRADGAACGYGFARDASYLVYAEQRDGQLWVSSCSRTRPMADADEDLAALGMGATPVDVKREPTPKPAATPEPAPDCSVAPGTRTQAAWAPWLGALALVPLRRLRPCRRSRSRS